jgi:hypothetical protein
MTDIKPTPMFPVDLDGAPSITLGGREWKVPKLVHGQNKRIVPAAMRWMPTLLPLLAAAQAEDASALIAAADALSEESYETLGMMARVAISQAHPGIGAGEFDQMPVSAMELLAALPVIIEQTGMFRKRQPGDADPPPGEKSAATPSTGTASPSASAAPQAGPGNT